MNMNEDSIQSAQIAVTAKVYAEAGMFDLTLWRNSMAYHPETSISLKSIFSGLCLSELFPSRIREIGIASGASSQCPFLQLLGVPSDASRHFKDWLALLLNVQYIQLEGNFEYMVSAKRDEQVISS